MNPHDIDGLKRAILNALSMPESEVSRRMRILRSTVKAHTVYDWARRFLDALVPVEWDMPIETGDAEGSDGKTAPVLDDVISAPVLLVACDYDGTISPHVDDPVRALPVRESIVACGRSHRSPTLMSPSSRAGLSATSPR